MRQPILTVFYQFNPWNPSIGGIQTCIRYVLKYAPSEFKLRLVGTSNDPKTPLGQWQKAQLFDRTFDFMPIVYVANDNIRGRIPTTLKYAMALWGRKFDSDFLQFHRLEPTALTWGWSGFKIFYIHNDFDRAISGASREGGIFWRRFPRVYYALERMLVPRFDRVLSCNTKSAETFKTRYPQIADRISYLPNTVDGDIFYPLNADERHRGRVELARELNLPDATRFILFAGRLHPQKQPLLLARTIAALQVENAHLLVVGQGELEADMRAETERLGIGDRVTFLDPMEQAKLARLYQISSLFVLTSAYEGLARGSIESLACGTPVVTTRAGETPNFLTPDSGIVCDEQTPTAIARSLEQVLEHPERYPTEVCVKVARPYNASHVVSGIYGDLLEQWQRQQGVLPDVPLRESASV